ncbi:hypothetical protein BX600DRAFT_443689 [Xylariales sp. PMI_506]|nr:hypothetical protein BX600DRAFT_443689 [Xylariales sp. PMI_506]
MNSTDQGQTALDLVLSLLHPSNTKSLDDYEHCLGWTAGEDRQCQKQIGARRRGLAKGEYEDLSGQQNKRVDGDSLELISKLLENRHCNSHINDVSRRFNHWKSKNCTLTMSAELIEETRSEMKNSSQVQAATGVHGGLDFADETVSSISSSGYMHLMMDDDKMLDSFTDLTLSPGQESDVSFSSTSVASTAVTTPDRTPMDPNDFPTLEHADEPCHETSSSSPSLSRSAKKKVILLEQDREVQELLRQEAVKGPEMATSLEYRLETVTGDIIPLLLRIKHDWTVREHEEGKVYIFQDDEKPDRIKIAWTTNDAHQRYYQPGNCYARKTTLYWQSPKPFKGARRVEQLVHEQLAKKNVPIDSCGSCKRKHVEWFEYDRVEARKLLELWTEFVAGDFYDHGKDTDGKPYGRLNENGRRFVGCVAQLNAKTLQQIMRTTSPKALHNVEEEQNEEGVGQHDNQTTQCGGLRSFGGWSSKSTDPSRR